jgi:hypothetical protein
MRCRHCGIRVNQDLAIPPFDAFCPKCARIASLLLVNQQGDGATGFREIMIRQNDDEEVRKLLETQTFHFIVFMNRDGQITGFDLEDRDFAHLLQWRRGRLSSFYGVANVGKGHHNRDEIYVNGSFDPTDVISELTKFGGNIRNEVRELLLEGIAGYRKKA